MPEALAVVKVGNSEWVLVKRTPSAIRAVIAGAVFSLTMPALRPSDTNSTTLCGRGGVWAAAGNASAPRMMASSRRIRHSPKVSGYFIAKWCERNVSDGLARQGGSLGQGAQFSVGDAMHHRRHAAIGAGLDALGVDELGRELQGLGHFLGRLDLVRRHVDGAHQHRLGLQKLHQFGRHMALPAFQRDLLDLAAIERGEGLLVLAPAVAQR